MFQRRKSRSKMIKIEHLQQMPAVTAGLLVERALNLDGFKKICC